MCWYLSIISTKSLCICVLNVHQVSGASHSIGDIRSVWRAVIFVAIFSNFRAFELPLNINGFQKKIMGNVFLSNYTRSGGQSWEFQKLKFKDHLYTYLGFIPPVSGDPSEFLLGHVAISFRYFLVSLISRWSVNCWFWMKKRITKIYPSSKPSVASPATKLAKFEYMFAGTFQSGHTREKQ